MTDKPTILVIDNSREDMKQLIGLLEDDYTVISAHTGQKPLEIARTVTPDIIVLDIVMPEMDGFEVCRQLKSSVQTSDIPVIFVSSHMEEDIEARGFAVGGADFIPKPFRPSIVHARLNNHLHLRSAMQELRRLYSLALDANPMTGLPGNNSIAAAIESALTGGQATCVIYTDLDNFKAFNDKYGFARGDEVILFTARILKDALDSHGRSDDFLGHIGGDDFVIVTPYELCRPLSSAIITSFEQGILQFYNSEDAKEKCIRSINRQGAPTTFPIMSISIAGVDLSHRSYASYIEVNDVCAEIKKHTKATEGSCFFLDQRAL